MNESPVVPTSRTLRWVMLVLIVVVIVLAVVYRDRLMQTLRPVSQQYSTEDLLAEVGRLVILPTGEEPVIATVTNLDALKDQPFFANAKIGDRVLIYNQAHKAILYSPTLKRVVDVAPFSAGSPSPTPKNP